jgi:hypothetical protein
VPETTHFFYSPNLVFYWEMAKRQRKVFGCVMRVMRFCKELLHCYRMGKKTKSKSKPQKSKSNKVMEVQEQEQPKIQVKIAQRGKNSLFFSSAQHICR